MKTICAWCNKTMSDDGNSAMISHGLCPKCEVKYFPANLNEVSAPLSQTNAIQRTVQSILQSDIQSAVQNAKYFERIELEAIDRGELKL